MFAYFLVKLDHCLVVGLFDNLDNGLSYLRSNIN